MLTLALTLRKRLLLLVCIFLVCIFIVSVVAGLVTWKFGLSTPAMRIVTVFQDVILFVLPPLITAMLVTRQPATLLAIDTRIQWPILLVAIATLIASIPAMDFVVMLNEKLPLPADIATYLRELEDTASGTIKVLMGEHTIASLIMVILIVGVMAGLSEELLFRGGLQRLLVTGGINPHAAIWISAALFSMLHMQFYGFVPRMLLGAFFGYTLYWTRCLWIPIILHTLNNTMYIIAEWYGGATTTPSLGSSLSDGVQILYILISAVLTAIGLGVLQRLTAKPHKP